MVTEKPSNIIVNHIWLKRKFKISSDFLFQRTVCSFKFMEKDFAPSLHYPSLLSLVAFCLLEIVIKQQFTTKCQGLHVKHRNKVKNNTRAKIKKTPLYLHLKNNLQLFKCHCQPSTNENSFNLSYWHCPIDIVINFFIKYTQVHHHCQYLNDAIYL